MFKICQNIEGSKDKMNVNTPKTNIALFIVLFDDLNNPKDIFLFEKGEKGGKPLIRECVS